MRHSSKSRGGNARRSIYRSSVNVAGVVKFYNTVCEGRNNGTVDESCSGTYRRN